MADKDESSTSQSSEMGQGRDVTSTGTGTGTGTGTNIQKVTIDNEYGCRELSYQCLGRRGSNGPGVVMVPGLGDGIRSKRGHAIQDFCHNQGIPFLTYDPTYMGLSEMSGGTAKGELLTLWHDDATHMLLNQAQGDKHILVGYSLGGTISINLTTKFPDRVVGLVLCAPVFNLPLMIDDPSKVTTMFPIRQLTAFILFNKVTRKQVQDFFQDAKNHVFPSDPSSVDVKCPVRIIQGMKDIFPYTHVLDLVTMLASCDVRVELLKEGDHYLKDGDGLSALIKNVKEILERVCQ